MKITFLGTGTSQGVPVIACDCEVCQSKNQKDKRLRSSVMLELNDTVIIIDAGPDFRYQMLREDVKKVDAILITHSHKDHIGGLDDVRAYNYIMRKPIDVYARNNAQFFLKREFYYAFEENKYPGTPEINILTLTGEPFYINGIKIIPIDLLHYKLHIFGFRINDFTYITDANYIPSSEINKIKGSRIVVINALRKKKHISHFNLDEALNILEDLKPEKGYLTHISHLMGLHEEVEKELPDFVSLAYDGLIISI